MKLKYRVSAAAACLLGIFAIYSRCDAQGIGVNETGQAPHLWDFGLAVQRDGIAVA